MAEAHALKLRTDDWAHDLERLVADLQRLGIAARAGAVAPAPAATNLGGVWMVFGCAAVLWLLVLAGAESEDDHDTYLGAAVVVLFPLAMFGYCFVKLKAVQHAGRWAALALAVLSGLMAMGYMQSAIGAGGTAAAAYRPPETSRIAPVM